MAEPVIYDNDTNTKHTGNVMLCIYSMYGYTTSNVYDIRSFIATNESFRPLRARSHVTSAIFQVPM